MLPVDQLAAIKVFVAVVDAGSLSAAGRRLSMPLTTVSRHLAALEDLIGVRLITRTTRELALTETGRHYLESCRRILAELDAARLRVAGAQDQPQGELAITAPVAFGRLHVLPIVTAFLKDFAAGHGPHVVDRSGGRSHRGGDRYLGTDRARSRIHLCGPHGSATSGS